MTRPDALLWLGFCLLAVAVACVVFSLASDATPVISAPSLPAPVAPTQTPLPVATSGPMHVVIDTAVPQPTWTPMPTAVPSATVQSCAVAKPGEWCWKATSTPPIRTPIPPLICATDTPDGAFCWRPTPSPSPSPERRAS